MTAVRTGMRRAGILCTVWLIVVLGAGCSSEERLSVPEPVDVETCDELVDISVQIVDVWLDVLSELPVEQLMADEPPPEFAELAAIGADLDERAARLGCDAAEINAAVRTELEQREDLASEDVVGRLLVDIVVGGVVGELPPSTSTTGGTS